MDTSPLVKDLVIGKYLYLVTLDPFVQRHFMLHLCVRKEVSKQLYCITDYLIPVKSQCYFIPRKRLCVYFLKTEFFKHILLGYQNCLEIDNIFYIKVSR